LFGLYNKNNIILKKMNKKTMYMIIGTTVLAGALIYLSIKDVFDFKGRAKKDKKCDKC